MSLSLLFPLFLHHQLKLCGCLFLRWRLKSWLSWQPGLCLLVLFGMFLASFSLNVWLISLARCLHRSAISTPRTPTSPFGFGPAWISKCRLSSDHEASASLGHACLERQVRMAHGLLGRHLKVSFIFSLLSCFENMTLWFERKARRIGATTGVWGRITMQDQLAEWRYL